MSLPMVLYRLYRPSLRHQPLVAQVGDAGRPQALADDFSVLGGRRRGQPAASSGSEGVANISFKL